MLPNDKYYMMYSICLCVNNCRLLFVDLFRHIMANWNNWYVDKNIFVLNIVILHYLIVIVEHGRYYINVFLGLKNSMMEIALYLNNIYNLFLLKYHQLIYQ